MPGLQETWRPAYLRSPQGISAEVLAEARRRLDAAGYHELRKIECAFDDGVLTLRGTVPWHHLKQRAFEIVADLKGVQRVSNDIDVRRPGLGA